MLEENREAEKLKHLVSDLCRINIS